MFNYRLHTSKIDVSKIDPTQILTEIHPTLSAETAQRHKIAELTRELITVRTSNGRLMAEQMQLVVKIEQLEQQVLFVFNVVSLNLYRVPLA